jgi:hypothetical protein
MAQSMAERAVDPAQIRALLARLTEQVRNGVLPPYGGIPIIQALTQKLSRAQNAAGMAQAQQQAGRPPIAQEVMQQAAMDEGVAALPSGLPQSYAPGGLVAFEEGGKVERYQNQGLVSPYRDISFEQLKPYTRETYDPTTYGAVDRAVLGTASALDRAAAKIFSRPAGSLRIDPVTNEPITFGEFQRRKEMAAAGAAAPVAQAMAPPAAAATAAPAAVAPTATPAAPPASQADRLRGDPIDMQRVPTPFTPFSLGDIQLPQGGAPRVALPRLNLPTMPVSTNLNAIVEGAPAKAKTAFNEARDAEEKALRAMTEPGESAREARFTAREAALARDSAIGRALNLMNVGFGIAGSKERTLAGALGNEGRQGIQALIQGEAANRVAKERYEDARDNFEQQKVAAKKGDRAAANAAGQRAADDSRAYTQLTLQAAQAGNADALQRYSAEQAGVLGKAQIEQAGALGQAGLNMQARQLEQQGILGLAGLNLNAAQLNQTAAYQNRMIDLNERRINAADAGTKARYAQVKVNALKQFDAGEGMQIARALSKEYGPKWFTGQDAKSLQAQAIYNQRRQAYLLGALDQAELLKETGARSADSLLGGNE